MTNKTCIELLYLDDIQVGLKFSSSSQAVDKAQIKAFAAQFDPQPFHLDEQAACNSIFGGLAASGLHTAAITMRLLVTGGAPIAGGLIGIGFEISWPQPTRPGDILNVETEIVKVKALRSRPDRGIVSINSKTHNQHDDVVQVMTAKLVVFRRPTSAGDSELPPKNRLPRVT